MNFFPRSASDWPYDMISLSTIPIVPTPALERNSADGHPSPPAPTIKTLEEIIFFWPIIPISFKTICLENLSIIFLLIVGITFTLLYF